jgi:hypothetical protein
MRHAHCNSSATLPPDHPPLLLVVVDTEEEFDWSLPHSRDNTSVSAIGAQDLAQQIFARHGIVPTYVVDYPVATTPAAVAVLKPFFDKGECRIGSHLHPWVNPPFEEVVNAANSYPGNLPPYLERAKLAALTEAISQTFGARPVVYKAGRYGIGPATAGILEELGYRIDVSVVPFTDFSNDGGPDFSGSSFEPGWFGRHGGLLEIPLSCGFHGRLKSLGPALFPHAAGALGMRLRVPGVLARSGLLERIRLTPEGVDLAANVRLARSFYQQGCRVFTFTYHSPSLVAGMTPYVSSESELADFLDAMDGFFAFFSRELGGRPSEPMEVYELLQRQDSSGRRGKESNLPASPA